MTKKDYITIANALKPYYKYDYSKDAEGMVEAWVANEAMEGLVCEIIRAISKQIKQDNPTFDSVKFLDYLRA